MCLLRARRDGFVFHVAVARAFSKEASPDNDREANVIHAFATLPEARHVRICVSSWRTACILRLKHPDCASLQRLDQSGLTLAILSGSGGSFRWRERRLEADDLRSPKTV